MNAPQGVAFFPGVDNVISATYTLEHGISPGICVMEIAPQQKIPTAGELQFSFGNVRLKFPDCIVDASSINYDIGGNIVSLRILDRRWKWREYGQISGRYNVPFPNGTIDTSTARSPRELATLCLEAMGETKFDVSKLPNTARPHIEWEVEIPAQALQRLCDDLGCRIILNKANRVEIVPTGKGKKLPFDEEIMQASGSLTPPEKPEKIVVIGGKSRFQHDFDLEAYGEESDGVYRPIDKLSYKPAGGWETQDASMKDVEFAYRPLAERSVYKYYAISRNEPLATVAGFGKVQGVRQILPIENARIELDPVDVIANTNLMNPPAPILWGVFFGGDAQGKNTVAGADPKIPKNPTPLTIYRDGYDLDTEFGMVKLHDPLYMTSGSGATATHKPAKLRLRVAFSIGDEDTLAWHRVNGFRAIKGGTKGLNLYVRHEDLILNTYPKGGVGGKPVDNLDQLRKASDPYFDAAEAEFNTIDAASASYAGLRNDFELDGAIQSITYSVGTSSGATTRISRNDEKTNPLVLPYLARRRQEAQFDREKRAKAKAAGLIAARAAKAP